MKEHLQGRTVALSFLICAGLFFFSFKCLIAHPVKTLNPGDPSAYATMARNIVEGKGLQVDYVSFHGRRYSSLPRPEDHWPPFYSILIAPFFAVMGTSAFAAKLPSIFISCALLPLVTFLLAESFGGGTIAALGAAFTVMLHPFFFSNSLMALADGTYAFLICAAALFAVKGLKREAWFLAMGVALGTSYYAKGTTIVLLPAFVVFLIMAGGGVKGFFRRRKLLVGLLIALAIMSGWWARNLVHFSNPLHSTQNLWAGASNTKGGVYGVYWDKELPSFLSKWALDPGKALRKAKKFLDYHIHWVLLDPLASSEEIPRIDLRYFLSLAPIRSCLQDFPSYPGGIPTGFFGIPCLAGLFLLRRKREIFIVPVIGGALVLFLSIFWTPINRLVLPAVPLVIALGWTSLADLTVRASRVLSRHLGTSSSGLSGVLLLSTILILTASWSLRADVMLWREGVKGRVYPFADSRKHIRLQQLARWISENTAEDAVVAHNKPWGLHFLTGRRTIHTPVDTTERTAWVLREYGVTHITDFRLWTRQRKSLKPLYEGEKPALEFLKRIGSIKIYRINHDLLASKRE